MGEPRITDFLLYSMGSKSKLLPGMLRLGLGREWDGDQKSQLWARRGIPKGHLFLFTRCLSTNHVVKSNSPRQLKMDHWHHILPRSLSYGGGMPTPGEYSVGGLGL